MDKRTRFEFEINDEGVFINGVCQPQAAEKKYQHIIQGAVGKGEKVKVGIKLK